MNFATGNSLASGSQEVVLRLPWIFQPAIRHHGR